MASTGGVKLYVDEGVVCMPLADMHPSGSRTTAYNPNPHSGTNRSEAAHVN